MQRRPAAQQPRRARVPARQAREGDRAAQGGVRGRARARRRRRRRDGRLVARAGLPEDRRSGRGRGARAPRAAAPRRPRGSPRRDRERAARARPRAARAGAARRGRGRCWPRRRTRSPSSRRARIGPQRGSRRATWPSAAATTVERPRSTGAPPRRSRTSGSRRREEVKSLWQDSARTDRQARIVLRSPPSQPFCSAKGIVHTHGCTTARAKPSRRCTAPCRPFDESAYPARLICGDRFASRAAGT